MANFTCTGSIKAVALRVGRLASGGAPAAGATNMYVTDALTEISLEMQVQEATERTVLNGGGDICQQLRDVEKVSGLNINLTLCELDAELLEMLTGAQILVSGGNTVGHTAPAVGAQANANGVSLEAWTWGWNGGARASNAFASPVYLHWVFPKVRFRIGNTTMNSEFMTVPLSGVAEENPQIATGPNNDLTLTGLSNGRLYSVFETATVPTASCGYIAQPAHP